MSKIYFSRSCKKPVESSPVGSDEVIIYQERVVDGLKQLVPVGKKSMNDFIQASKEECDVYRMLERFNRGDQTALFRTEGHFIDVTALPKSLAEAHQLLIDTQARFDSLPLDVRNAFGNNVHEFIKEVSSGSVDALRKCGIVVESPAPVSAGGDQKEGES